MISPPIKDLRAASVAEWVAKPFVARRIDTKKHIATGQPGARDRT
jgi:hypothetical protein